MTAKLIPQKINQMIDGRYLIFYAALTVSFLAVSYDEMFSFVTTACCYDCKSNWENCSKHASFHVILFGIIKRENLTYVMDSKRQWCKITQLTSVF